MGGLTNVMDLESLSLPELQQLERNIKMRKRELLVNEELRKNVDLLEEYLQNYDSPCTRRMYKTAVKKFITFMKGKNLQFTTKFDLERYFEELNDSTYRIKTKRTYLEGVKSFFKYFLHYLFLWDKPQICVSGVGFEVFLFIKNFDNIAFFY